MKDSQAYLDHLNGRNHNRLLGMSLEVEKSSVEKVSAKILALKAKRNLPEPEAKRMKSEEPIAQPAEPEEPDEIDEEATAIAKLIGKSSFSSTKK